MGPGLSGEFWINLFSGTIHRNNFSHSLESFWFIVSAPEDVVRLCLVKIILKGRWKEANLVPSLPHKMLFFLFFSFFLFFFPSFLPFFFVLCPFLKVILNLFSYLQLWVQKKVSYAWGECLGSGLQAHTPQNVSGHHDNCMVLYGDPDKIKEHDKMGAASRVTHLFADTFQSRGSQRVVLGASTFPADLLEQRMFRYLPDLEPSKLLSQALQASLIHANVWERLSSWLKHIRSS